MVWPDNGQQKGNQFVSPRTLLITLFFFLPLAIPSLFGWFNGLLAVPVFMFLQTCSDERQAIVEIRNGVVLAGVGALLVNQLPLLVFALAMLPLGYSLHRSYQQEKSPVRAAGTAVIVLALGWFVFWAMYGIIAGINPYSGLLTMLDSSFEQIIKIYQTNSELPADVQFKLELAIGGIRDFLPRILPGLLIGSVIITVWLNMVIGNTLIHRLKPENTVWPQYSCWQLPEKLIWLLITAAVLSLIGAGVLRNIGYCLLIIAVIIYFFQGMAIFIHFLNRWNVPNFFRIILYVVLALQSYGILILAMAGVADIWIDFRKLSQDEPESSD